MPVLLHGCLSISKCIIYLNYVKELIILLSLNYLKFIDFEYIAKYN